MNPYRRFRRVAAGNKFFAPPRISAPLRETSTFCKALANLPKPFIIKGFDAFFPTKKYDKKARCNSI